MLNFKKAATLALSCLLALSVLTAAGCDNSDSSSACAHEWSEWTVTAEATCEEKGERERTCSLCADKQTEAIEATGHSYGEWQNVAGATCAKEGSQKRVCANDSTHIERRATPKDTAAHYWDEGTVTAESNCTTAGNTHYVCQNGCGASYDEPIPASHVWGDWEMDTTAGDKLPTCTEAGQKRRYCTECTVDGTPDGEPTVEVVSIPARGHSYNETTSSKAEYINEHYVDGVCTVCGMENVVKPADDATITYINPDNASGITGNGTAYNRFELTEGYYEIQIARSGTRYLSFQPSEPGQYAFYSIGNENAITATRYFASVQNLGEAVAARVLDNNDFYSVASFAESGFNENWRATFELSGTHRETVKVRFVRIADAAWAPSTVTETVEAKEIQTDSSKLPTVEENKIVTLVPYDAEYFYDESIGYYRMGTPENKGKIIYAAITKAAERQLGDVSFASVNMQEYVTDALSIVVGKTVEGDNLKYNYGKFISNRGGDPNADKDLTALCYENYANADGLYPVNRELYAFLSAYASVNDPLTSGYTAESKWLAACYYYADPTPGTVFFPIAIEETGDIEITTKPNGFTYYSITATEETTYTLSSSDENAVVMLNKTKYSGVFTETFTVNAGETLTFYVGALDGSVKTFTLTLTEAA